MKLKSFLAVAAGSAVLAGALVGIGTPALADPAAATAVAGGGSDTTQDVMDAIAKAVAPSTIGSWNALPVHSTIQTHSGTTCATITRPNGSGEGVTALRRSLSGTFKSGTSGPTYPNTTATYSAGTGNNPPALGSQCFEFARSSGGPGTNASTTGNLQYVPFALDGLTSANGPASGTDATVITDTFTFAQLQAMYTSGTNVTIGAKTYDPNPADGTTGTAIHLLIPQSGSGSRAFWLAAMGITGAVPAWVKDTFVPTAGGAAQSVEENDGTPVRLDHNAIMPFSIAQWIAQSTGHNDRRDGARLMNVSGLAPISGGKLNASFVPQLLREVYNVIPFNATTAAGAALIPNGTTLYNFFVNPSASNPLRLCGRTSLITEYGFGVLNGTGGFHTCGQIVSTLRAYSDAQW